MALWEKWGAVYKVFFWKWGTDYMATLKSLWTLSRWAKNCAFRKILESCLSQKMLGAAEKQAHSYSHSVSSHPSKE